MWRMSRNQSSQTTVQTTNQTADDKYRQMTEAPVERLVLTLAGPAILANLVTAIYNICDTYFVGQLGTSAEGAVGISFVAMTLIQSVGFGLGQGTGNAISRALGRQDRELACIYTNVGLASSLVAGILIAVLGNIFITPLCLLSGSTATILPYARVFVGIILMGAPFMCSTLMLNFQLRMEGEAFYSMLAIMSGAVLNTALTPFLIYVVGMGIAGSATSTVICEGMSFFLLCYLMNHIGITPLSRAWLRRPDRAMVGEIFNGGFPSFIRQVMLGMATTLLNMAARPFGDAAIAAMAIVQRVSSLGNYMQIGIGQGFQPTIGYNYGAKKYDRIRTGYHFSKRAAFVVVAAIGVCTFVLAEPIVRIFSDDPEVIPIAVLALRIESVTLPITGSAMITNFLLQTTGRMWRATILGACRLGLVLGPVVVVLPPLLGLLGVQLAQPVTDLITFGISLPMEWAILRELGEEEQAEDSAR